MDKTILVFNININSVGGYEKLTDYTQHIHKNINAEEFLIFIIPIENGDSNIQCINPVLLEKELYKKEFAKIVKLKDNLEKTISDLKSMV